MDRLTDPIMRENYLLYGNPDGEQQPIISCALPKETVVDATWSNILMFGYVTIIALGLPGCVGLWWSQPRKTTDGLLTSTAQRFFSSTSHQRNLGFAEIITLLSECEEIVSLVRSIQSLDTKKMIHIYSNLRDKREMDLYGSISVQLLSINLTTDFPYI